MTPPRAVRTLQPPAEPLQSYSAVVEYLRREMALGRLRHGDRLPSTRKLAEDLGIARETLRQALRVLEGSGQITIHLGAHGGAVVQEPQIDRDLLFEDIVQRADQVLEVIEFRQVVESAAARLAAMRRSDEDVRAMRDAQETLRGSTVLGDCRDSDTAFHLAIAKAAGNSELLRAIEDARVKSFASVDLLDVPFIHESSLSAHDRILVAIESRDAELAEQHMRDHLAETRREFEAIFKL